MIKIDSNQWDLKQKQRGQSDSSKLEYWQPVQAVSSPKHPRCSTGAAERHHHISTQLPQACRQLFPKHPTGGRVPKVPSKLTLQVSSSEKHFPFSDLILIV